MSLAVPSAPAQAPQYHPPVVAANDTLAGVDYNYRYELYGGASYSHFNAGPTLLQGANLGGFTIDASRFFTKRWAAMGSARGYYGTSGVVANPYLIRGPFVSQYMFMAGPEYRVASNQHASLTLHALFGGAYGEFTSGLQVGAGQTVQPGCVGSSPNAVAPNCLGLFNNQLTFGSAFGGTIDLNRSARWAFRIQPEGTLTDYGGAGLHEQVAVSVGVVYRLGRKIVPVAPGAPRRAANR